jgi:hypothetical protein
MLQLVMDETDKKLEDSAIGASLDYNEGDPELSFSMGFTIRPEFSFDFDLGTELQKIGLNTTASATVSVASEFNLYTTFGVKINKMVSDPISEAVFFKLDDVSVLLTISVYDIDLDMDLGFVQAVIEDAGFTLIGEVSLQLATENGRVTVGELLAGNFFDLFAIEVDKLQVQMGVALAEAFVGVGRDTDKGLEGTGVLVNVEDLGMMINIKFPKNTEGKFTGEVETDYALTGGGSGELLGVPDIVVDASMLIRMNSTGGEVKETIETGGEPIDIVFSEDEGNLKRVEMSGKIEVAGFFYMSGNFALETNVKTFSLKDGTTLIDADLFTIGGSDGTAFAGINGPADKENALGLYITDVEFGIAIIKPAKPEIETDPVDGRTFTALKANVGAAKFIGVEGMVVSFDDFYVAVNTGTGEDANGDPNNTVVNFSVGAPLDVNTGDGNTIALDFDSKVIEMRGSLTLGVFGFFYIDGDFAIKKSETTVTLTDGNAIPVNYLSIGATDVDAFAGVSGPYFTDLNGDGVPSWTDVNGDGVVDSADDLNTDGMVDPNESDELNESALGLSLRDVNFAILFMKAAPPLDPDAEITDTRSWTAVTAEVGGFEFVGIGDLGIHMTVSDIKLKLNMGGGAKDGEDNETVVDFKEMQDQGSPFTIKTGDVSEITFDYAGEFFGVEATITLNVFDFFHVSGSFAFEKTEGEVLLSDGQLLDVELLTVGASNVFAFAGVNGPYWLGDTNLNGQIDPDETNDRALGFSLEQVNFALAFIKPKVTEDISQNSAYKRTWTTLKAEVGRATIVGVDNITVRFENFYVGFNTGGGSFGGMANTTFVDYSFAPLDVNTGGGNFVTFDFDSDILQAYGKITLEIYDFFHVTGSFGFTKKSMTVTLNDDDVNPSQVEVELLTLGASNVTAFAGVNGPANQDGAMGFYLEDVDFALALMKVTPDVTSPEDKRTWMALDARVGEASIIGIEGITLSMTDFAIAVNQGGGTNNGVNNEYVVDFSTTALQVETSSDDAITFDFMDELLQAEGSVALSIYGFFFVSGRFAFEKKKAGVRLNDHDPADDPIPVEMLTIGASNVEAFAGVNGPADESGALGLSLVNANFALAMIKPTAPVETDTRSWLAVYSYVETAEFIGIEDLTMSISDIYVSVNQGSGSLDDLPNETVVDFTQSDFDLDPLSNPDGYLRVKTGTQPEDYVDIDYTRDFLSAEAAVDINLFGFFYLEGTFAFEKSETLVTLDDGTPVPVQLLTVGAHVPEAFAGVNGPYLIDPDGNGIDEPNEAAMGLSLTGVDFALAMMKPNMPSDPDVEPTDLRSWTALRADVVSAEFVGVEDLTIEVRDLYVAVNQGGGRFNGGENTTVVDFSVYDKDGEDPVDGFMAINTGNGNSVQIDFSEAFVKAQATIELGIFDFFFLKGNFAIEKSKTTVTLSDNTSVVVEVLTIGGSDISAFAGINGPYLIDPEKDGTYVVNEAAMGLSLNGVDFALAFLKAEALNETSTDKRTWTALKASVGQAEVVGIAGLTLSVTEFYVAVNQGGGHKDDLDNETVIDFTAEVLPVKVGGDNFIDLDFKKQLLTAHGTVRLNLFGFFFVTGNFAFEKTATTVNVRDITTGDLEPVEVQLLTLGASKVDAFAGVNGPADNEGALGFALENVNFAIALMKREKDPAAPDDLRTWTSMVAEVNDARFIGLEDMTLSVSQIEVRLNQGGGTLGGQDNNTYVDFSQYDDDGVGHIDGFMTVQAGPDETIQLDLYQEILSVEAFVEINLFGFFYVSGFFAFEKSNATVTLNDPLEDPVPVEMLTLGASNVEAFAGVNGPADEPGAIGLSLTGVDFAIVLMKAKAPTDGSSTTDRRTWTAVKAKITEAALVGIDNVEITVTNFWVLVNQGGGAKDNIDNTTVVDFKQSDFDNKGEGLLVNTGGGNHVDVNLTEALIKVDGHITITIAGHGMEGDFTFEQTTNESGGRVIKAAMAGVEISFLSGGTSIIEVYDIHGTLVINSTGLAGELEMGIRFNGDLGSINIDAEARVNLAVNTSSEAIYEEIEIQGEVQVIDLPAGPYVRVAAYGVDLQFPGPVTLSGNFQFESITIDGVKYVRIAATKVYVNLLDKGEINDGYGGMIFSSLGVAGILKGNVTLDAGYGIEGEGDASFQINTTGAEVNQVITVQGTEIRIAFTDPSQYDFVEFAVTNATLKFGDYVQLTGDYKMGKEGDLKLIGAKNVTLFLGDGPYEIVDIVETVDENGNKTTSSTKVENPFAVGVLVKNARLGVVMFPDKSFALIAEGEAALVGVDGLNISGSITARVNNSGQTGTWQVTMPDDTGIEVSFQPVRQGAFYPFDERGFADRHSAGESVDYRGRQRCSRDQRRGELLIGRRPGVQDGEPAHQRIQPVRVHCGCETGHQCGGLSRREAGDTEQ